jgi:hypothetical protein
MRDGVARSDVVFAVLGGGEMTFHTDAVRLKWEFSGRRAMLSRATTYVALLADLPGVGSG